jgi:hypothetical protein
MRFRLVSILAVGALLVAAAVALAAKPKKGYTYSSGAQPPSVFFKAKSGKKLTDFSAGFALKCTAPCGGFGGVKSLTKKSVTVKKGKFKVSGNIYAEGPGGSNGRKLGSETVTGKFLTSTDVVGKVTTHMTLGSGPHAYHGTTERYSAAGAPSTG